MKHPTHSRKPDADPLRTIAGAAVPFQSSLHHACISVPTGPASQQVFAVRSPQCKQWLRTGYEDEFGRTPSESFLRTSLHRLEAQAVYSDLPAKPVGPRCLAYGDRVALDLANPAGDCIEISAAGWKTASALSHAFTRDSAMGPLPEPQQPEDGALDQFRVLLNIPDGNPWTRVLSFLTAAVTGLGPCPILVLEGPTGSAKTTAARMLKALLDPTASTPGPLPSGVSALRKQAAENRVLIFDDVHRIGPVKASEIARLADDEAQPRAIILVRACSSTAPLPEALERRALTVALAVPETLRTLYDLKNEFQRIHPQVLGALCNAVAETLKGLHSTPVPKLTRLADATMLALAAAPSLRLQHQHILEAIAERPPKPLPAPAEPRPLFGQL